MAIDVSYRDGFETSALDLSRLNKNIFKSSGVHTDASGNINGSFSVIEQSVPNLTVQVLAGTSDFYGADGETMYTFTTDSTENVTITPAVHTVVQTRIDIIVLKVDTSTKIATIEAVAGTPATTGSEVIPTTPAGTYKLADVSIVGGTTAITDAMITDRRTPINIYSRNSITGWNRIYQTGFEYQSTIGIKTSINIDLTQFLGRGDKIRIEQVTTGITFWNIKNINYNSTVANRTYIEFEQSGVADNVINSVEFSKNITPSGFNQFYLPYKTPEGQLIDGYIDVAVAGNNLTVRVLHDTGVTPSITRPVFININGTVRRITSALSVTANAGTNWFKLGDGEMATFATDLFVYLGFNSTDGITIGFSRIPYANLYSQFSTTNTDDKFCRISTITNASANDVYTVIGRFSATLSAGAGYTWTIPTFTADNLIQRPIYETRELSANHIIIWTGGTTDPSTTSAVMRYKIRGNKLRFNSWFFDSGTGAKDRTNANVVLPFSFNPVDSARDIIVTRVISASAIVGVGSASMVTGNNFDITVSMTTATFEMYTSGEITI